jgi:hypothetical protein
MSLAISRQNNYQSYRMVDIARGIQNLQQRKKYINTIPTELERSIAMFHFSKKIRNKKEQYNYIESIPNEVFRSMAMGVFAKKIENKEERINYIKRIPSLIHRSKAMKYFARDISNKIECLEYIEQIPYDDERKEAISEFMDNNNGQNINPLIQNFSDPFRSELMSIYAFYIVNEQRADYIQTISDQNMRSDAMINFATTINDPTLHQNYILRIPNLQIRSRAMFNYLPNIVDRIERLNYIQRIPNQEIRNRAFEQLEEEDFFTQNWAQQSDVNKKNRPLQTQKLIITEFINDTNKNLQSSKVSIQGLKLFFNTYKIPYQGLKTKQEFMDALTIFKKELNTKRKKGQLISQVHKKQQGVDFFGKQIINPVLGNDGEIYDKSSADLWLENRTKFVIVGGSIPLKNYRNITKQEYQFFKNKKISLLSVKTQ